MSETLGLIYVILSGAGFGFLGVFGRWGYQSGLSIGELLSFRFILASAVFWIGLLLTKPQLTKLPLKEIIISSSLGVFGYAVFSTLYFKSIEGISVALAALLLFTFPIFVNLGAHFLFKERMSRHQFLSLILACVGLLILLWGPLVVSSLNAVFYALMAAITYSIYVLISGQYQRHVNPLSSSLYIITATAFSLVLFHQPSLIKITELSYEQIWIIVGIALVSTIAPLTLFLAGLQKLSSSKASIVVMIEPVVATLAGWVLLGEQLSGLQLIGALLVLLALLLTRKNN